LNKDQFSTYILQNLDLQQKESMKMSVSSRLSQSKTHFYGTGVSVRVYRNFEKLCINVMMYVISNTFYIHL